MAVRRRWKRPAGAFVVGPALPSEGMEALASSTGAGAGQDERRLMEGCLGNLRLHDIPMHDLAGHAKVAAIQTRHVFREGAFWRGHGRPLSSTE